jgi:preprotein translocase subunit Sec61beta
MPADRVDYQQPKAGLLVFSSEARFKGVNLAPKEKVRSETGNEM